jgi:hypothetical protein
VITELGRRFFFTVSVRVGAVSVRDRWHGRDRAASTGAEKVVRWGETCLTGSGNGDCSCDFVEMTEGMFG